MKRSGAVFVIAVSAVLLFVLQAAGYPREKHMETELDLTQYESMILDIAEFTQEGFTGYLPWAYPCTYRVNYQTDGEFCVGDRVEVYYTSLIEEEDAHSTGQWSAEVDAVFVDYSYFQLDPNAAYKPVIYLYPERETTVEVTLDYDGALTRTSPVYGDGWRVTAAPDGTLTTADGKTYPHLFWEGEGAREYDMGRGFCVAGGASEAFLREALAEQGLNERESRHFLKFWLPRLEENAYNLIAFQTERYTEGARLTVTPAPDTLIRVFMAFRPLDAPVEIEPQTFAPVSREGFTVVEWGGALAE